MNALQFLGTLKRPLPTYQGRRNPVLSVESKVEGSEVRKEFRL
jgi:hypothetical protein